MKFLCGFADNKPLLIGILAAIVGILVIAMIANAIQQHVENKREARHPRQDELLLDETELAADETELAANEREFAADETEPADKTRSAPADAQACAETDADAGTANEPHTAPQDDAESGERRGNGGKALDSEDWSEL